MRDIYIEEACDIDALNTAFSDRKERLRQHAKRCVVVAGMTGEPLAADFIDEAIAFRTESSQD